MSVLFNIRMPVYVLQGWVLSILLKESQKKKKASP